MSRYTVINISKRDFSVFINARIRPLFANPVTYVVVYTVHMISQYIDGEATEADSGASVLVGLSVAMPLSVNGYTNLLGYSPCS